MFRQSYNFARPEIFKQELRRYRPGGLGTFTSSVREAFYQTPAVQAMQWLEYGMAGSDFYSNPETTRPVTKTEFEDFVGDLPLQYQEGITFGQMDILTKEHAREAAYGWFNKNVGMWEPSRIGGFLLGSLPDPLMLMPLGGVVSRMATTAKAVNKGIGIGINGFKKPIGNVLKAGSEGALYAGIAEGTVLVPKKEKFQQPWGWQQALVDVGFAFGAGASLSAFVQVAPSVIKAPSYFKIGALTKVSKDLGDGELGSIMPDDYKPKGPNDPLTPAGPRHPEHNVKPEHVANQTAQESDGILGNAQKHFEAARANETFNTIRDSLGETADNILTPEFQKKVVDFTGSVVNRTADEFEKIINFGIDCIKKNK